jgi:hypothetical protein
MTCGVGLYSPTYNLPTQQSGNNLLLKTQGAAGAEGINFSNWYAATTGQFTFQVHHV